MDSSDSFPFFRNHDSRSLTSLKKVNNCNLVISAYNIDCLNLILEKDNKDKQKENKTEKDFVNINLV